MTTRTVVDNLRLKKSRVRIINQLNCPGTIRGGTIAQLTGIVSAYRPNGPVFQVNLKNSDRNQSISHWLKADRLI